MKQTSLNLFSLLSLTAVLGGCANTASQEASVSSEVFQIPHVESRAVVRNNCIFATTGTSNEAASFLAAVGATLIPKAIDAGVNALAVAVRQAGKADKVNILDAKTTSHAFELDITTNAIGINKAFGCLIVAKGTVNAPDNSHKRAPWDLALVSEKRDRLKSITGINTDPEFYYEALMIPSGDRNSFRLQSTRFEYFGKLKTWRNAVDVLLDVKFSAPGGASGATAFGLTTLVFKGVKPGVVMDEKTLAGHSSLWIPFPTMPTSLTALSSSISLLKDKAATKTAQAEALNKMDDPTYNKLRDHKEKIRVVTARTAKTVVTTEDVADKLQDNHKGKDQQFKRASDRLGLINARVEAELSTSAPVLLDRLVKKKAIEDEVLGIDRQIKNLQKHPVRGAINIEATVSQINDANKFLIAVADILDSSKADLGAAAKAQLDPATKKLQADQKKQQAELALQAKHTQRLAVLTADQLVESLSLELSRIKVATDPTLHLTKTHALQNAKLNANEARRRADMTLIHIIGSM